MNRSVIIVIIAITLLGFILLRSVAALLCEPQQANPVVNAISSIIPSSESIQKTHKQDPLSWDPALHILINFFLKACTR